MSYLKWVSASNRHDRESWHVLERVDDLGWHLRCGRVITTDKADASPTLPFGERSCEACLAGQARDSDPPNVSDDEVFPPADDDTVPG